MYPFIRLAKSIVTGRRADPLPVFGTHVSRHICWPWDIDAWVELNNGRTLTLFDLGRIPLAIRTGLAAAVRQKGWGIAVAGVAVRYRRRVRAFQRVTMKSRCIGWDARFFYMEQSMWRAGECTTHMLLRAAVTGEKGIVAPADVAAAMAADPQSPPLPDWALAWIAAEALRPWPPQM